MSDSTNLIKNRMRHNRIDHPAYLFYIYERPKSLQSTNIRDFQNTIQKEAKKLIKTPIIANDIEIEICWATNAREGCRADIDNIIKPIIDALIGIAYNDDKQIRSVSSTLFDQNKNETIAVMLKI